MRLELEAETVSWPLVKEAVARRGGLCAGGSGGAGVSVGVVAGMVDGGGVCALCAGGARVLDWACRVAANKTVSADSRAGIEERMRLLA